MMIAGVFADPGAGIDWIALIQIALAFALLSVCCWLIGVTLQRGGRTVAAASRCNRDHRSRPGSTARCFPASALLSVDRHRST